MNQGRYEIYAQTIERKRRMWRWRYRAGNGEIIASGEAYSRRIDCEHAVSLMQDSGSAPVRNLECA